MTRVPEQASAPLTAAAFEARFNNLIELICDAAQLGQTRPFMEAQYIVLRTWMQENFPPIASHFSPRLCLDFEALYQPETLSDLLAHDSGHLMTALLLTQDAVAAWKSAPKTVEILSQR